jgi:hypothetical protein
LTGLVSCGNAISCAANGHTLAWPPRVVTAITHFNHEACYGQRQSDR